MSVPRAENSRWNGIAVFAMKFRRRTTLKHWCGSAAVRACGRSEELWTPCQDALLPAILSVRRHWLPMTACKRAIVCRIADAPIKAASRQAMLAFRSLDPLRALREPERRRRDMA